MAPQVYRIADLTDDLADAIDAARKTTNDQRWINAIDAGASWLLEQDQITFDATAHELTFPSASGKTYHANGSCYTITGEPCKAFRRGEPCYHRAAAKIARNAIEAREARTAKRWEAMKSRFRRERPRLPAESDHARAIREAMDLFA
jgi:pyrimidine deaminase RibD-like protein